jgi:serine/threonine protein kinase
MPLDDVLIGKQLGDYVLTQRLAMGGMARIYLGVDPKLGRQAAVKVLDLDKLVEEDMPTQRFQREARAIAQLEHPNIITVYQYGEQDGVYFLAMKLIKGTDLAHELNRLRQAGERMGVDRALRILAQVAAALDVAHDAGIIHRDVKPSNILLDQKDSATLTDFGLVFQPSLDTTQGTAFGTPRYISPEQALSSNSAVPQSDLYSLAVIAYQILVGRVPFSGESPLEIALAHINTPPPPPRSINPGMPVAAERELLKALDKNPLMRHQRAAEFITALQQIYSGSDDQPVMPHAAPHAAPETIKFDVDEPEVATSLWQDVVIDEPPARHPRRRAPLVAAVGIVLVGLMVLVSTLVSQSPSAAAVPTTAADTPAASNTFAPGSTIRAAAPAPPEPTAQIMPVVAAAERFPVKLIYSDTFFTIVNTTDRNVDVHTLIFQRGDDQYSGDAIVRRLVPAGSCFRLQLQARQNPLPSECGGLHAETLLPDPLHFFWRSEPVESASFEVLDDGELLTTCPTVARGGSSQCDISLPEAPAA